MTDLRFAFFATLLPTLALAGCGGSDSATPPPPVADPPPPPVAQSEDYAGPGSKWDASLRDDDTFVFTRRQSAASAVDMRVEGTYVRTDLGFVVMTVATGTGSDAPSAGDRAWAVEAPGYALMLHTDGDRFIPMIESGACPEEDVLSNWVIARHRLEADPTATDGDFFGTFEFVAATGVASLPSQYALSEGFPAVGSSGSLDAVSCADGVASVDDADMFLTTNGGAIVHTNISQPAESSVIFALAQKTATSVAALDAEYAGIAFDASAAADARVSPVILACGNGQCSGQFVTDVAAGTTAGSFFVDLSGSINVPEPGFITGVVRNADGASGRLACAIDEDANGSGRSMLSCVGQAPGDNTRLFNLFMVSN